MISHVIGHPYFGRAQQQSWLIWLLQLLGGSRERTCLGRLYDLFFRGHAQRCKFRIQGGSIAFRLAVQLDSAVDTSLGRTFPLLSLVSSLSPTHRDNVNFLSSIDMSIYICAIHFISLYRSFVNGFNSVFRWVGKILLSYRFARLRQPATICPQ
jgi:hypothetical protein